MPIAKSRWPKRHIYRSGGPGRQTTAGDIFGTVEATVKNGAKTPVYSSFIAADKNGGMFATTKPQDTKLEPGTRYRAREGGIWELRGLVNVQAKQPHVMLFDVHDHKITKVVSVHALMDTSLFKRVEAASERKMPVKASA